MTISKSFDNYLTHVKKYRAHGTYLYYRKNFKVIKPIIHELQYKEEGDIDNLFFENIIDYFLSKTTKKNSKINDAISCIITAFNYNNIKYPKRYKLKDDTESFRALSEDEFNQMLNYIKSLDINKSNNLSWSLAVCLFLDTGVRLSELLDLRFKNVDLDHDIILLDHTKNGKKRYAFFDTLSKDLLIKAKKKNHEHVLWNYDKNKPIDKYSLEHFFNKINRHVDSPYRIHAHRLRKTFATKLLRKGCPLTTISKLLGHQDIRQTMIYLEIDQVMLNKDYREFYPYEIDKT